MISLQLPYVKNRYNFFFFCKCPKIPAGESEGVSELGAVSQKQTNGFERVTPRACAEWLAATFALRIALVITVQYSWSLVPDLCALIVICLMC